MQLPIVLVEDDQLIRESLHDFLDSEGFRVRSAENGLKGLELIREQKGACLVLLDLQMPVMTGEELLDALAKESDPSINQVPVVVLTARTDDLKNDKVRGFIRKPVDLEELLEKVRSHCAEAVCH